MTRTLIVTGGAGFIGSNFLLTLAKERPDWTLVNLDALTYAGNLENLVELEGNPRCHFVHGDICERADVERAFEAAAKGSGPVSIVHFAAESHVDRSIQSSLPFVRTNVLGTQVLIDAARAHGVERFVHVSTDEVYGSLGERGYFTEETPLAPNSPYSASKAGSDLLVRAAVHTFGFPGLITRCSNNYGPYQFPEKLIPLVISLASEGKPIPVYGDGLHVRDWLYVVDHCEAILAVLERGTVGSTYNIGGHNEYPNLEIVRRILSAFGQPESLIQFVKDRPGHDRRYAIDASRIERELGWRPRWRFEDALPRTIAWYRSQTQWLQRVRNGAYREYLRRQYGP
ncbi:MAG: dTDP-glucose 4,6-dehydratase [Planctomycetaceae bacterium]|jgi:dTDP-glucose 4,6-dehydratase|nr:dTDP-glucose 4,6-dehydratase [Planctomycetaceae bacterium]